VAHAGHLTLALATLVLAGFVAATVAGASLITRRLPPPLEWFGVCTAALVVVAFTWPSGFSSTSPRSWRRSSPWP
jgi:drug/metabolite transporter (DMT)-like permease